METIKENDFRQMLADSKIPIVAYFGAEWCSPCKMFAPIFSEASEKAKKDKANIIGFVKIDVDEAMDLSSELNIQAVPTILLFDNAQVKKTHVGVFRTAAEVLDFAKK